MDFGICLKEETDFGKSVVTKLFHMKVKNNSANKIFNFFFNSKYTTKLNLVRIVVEQIYQL